MAEKAESRHRKAEVVEEAASVEEASVSGAYRRLLRPVAHRVADLLDLSAVRHLRDLGCW